MHEILVFLQLVWPPGSPKSDFYARVCETTFKSTSVSLLSTFIMQTAPALKTLTTKDKLNRIYV